MIAARCTLALALALTSSLLALGCASTPRASSGGEASGGVARQVARPIDRSKVPAYPQHLLDACVTGAVLLLVEVGADGATKRMKVLSSVHPELDELSMAAVKEFVWEPARLDGRAVASRVRYRFVWKTDSPCDRQAVVIIAPALSYTREDGGCPSGVLRLRVTVSTEGAVDAVKVIEGISPSIDGLSTAYVEKTKWLPATEGGKPVASTVPYAVRWEPTEGCR